MYNLIKLQKHDAFYKSREGGKCSIKCFNADCGMPCRPHISHLEKNMGNMGFLTCRIWDKIRDFSRFL